MLQLGFVYELPFMRDSTGALAQVVKGWQVNGIGAILSGAPFTVGGDNGAAATAGRAADGERLRRAQRRVR